MQKYVKIVLRDKTVIHLSIEKWQNIIEDKNMFVAYRLDEESEWSGRTLNKLEVMYSEYDKEYSIKKNEPKYKLYRNKETNSIIKLIDGQLPDDFDKYEKID